MAAVRWTCYHPDNKEYCQREHKSEEAARNCAKRTANFGGKADDWETLEVEKGFYRDNKHKD